MAVEANEVKEVKEVKEEIRYGKLVVDTSKGVKYTRSGVRQGARKALQKREFVYVKCDCGNEKWIRTDQFKYKIKGKNKPQSCNACDSGKGWIGKKFGYWTVIDVIPVKKSKVTIIPDKSNKKIKWRVQCVCGKTVDRIASDIRNGKSLSCGCVRNREIDLIGKQFGHLQVLDKFPKSQTGQKSMWLCRCSCGGEVNINSCRLIRGITKSCGCVNWKSLKNNRGVKFEHETKVGEFNNEEIEFMNAVEFYKRANGIKLGWLTPSQTLEVVRKLGYHKLRDKPDNLIMIDEKNYKEGLMTS